MNVVFSRRAWGWLGLGAAALTLTCGVGRLWSQDPAPQRWSDAGTWGGRPPGAGATVTISKGQTVLLDVSPPPLARLDVQGTLRFADTDLSLQAGTIDVSGRMEIGSAGRPFRHRTTLTLTAGPEEKTFSVTGDLELHGVSRGVSWTHLAITAPAGTRQITLEAAPGWHVGDEIAVASTDYDAHQAETETVRAVAGPTVTLARPLRFTHWGQVVDGVDERGEVGLLTRGIVVQGDADSARGGEGGHLMIMRPGTAHLENAEFRRMGQRGRLGRYPIHFHLAGDLLGAYVRGCSIHDCYNRALTLHGTDRVRVSDNVAYNIVGHCFFLEDATETGNVLEHNLGILTRRASPGQATVPSDVTPATYWITNPDNVLVGNVAAGSDGNGFWFDLPKHPTGLSRSAENDRNVWPRRTTLSAFAGNVAHSDGNDGLFVDNGANPPGVSETPNYDPPAPADFADMTAYKNRRRGLWLRGSQLIVSGARLADNAIGVTFAASRSELRDSWVVGETMNGRSLPKPAEPAFPRTGFEFYDGLVGARNVTFVNFEPDARRPAGALSYLRGTPFFVDPRNYIAGARFVHAVPVFLEHRAPPHDPKAGADGYRSALFVDRDGSVMGRPGWSVAVDNPFLRDTHALVRPEWNLLVSDAPFGRLFLDNRDPHPAPIGPVTLTRLDGARPTHQLWGIPNDGGAPNISFQTTLIADSRYAARLHGPMPAHLRLTLRFRPAGDWMEVTLPYPSPRVFVYRDGDFRAALPPAADLAAFAAAGGAKYFLSRGVLSLRLAVRSDSPHGKAALDISRVPLPASAR